MSIKNIVIKSVNALPFGLRSRIRNIPVAKQLQSFLLKKYVSDNEFIATISGGPAKGLVFPVQMPQDKLMWIGTWELEFSNTLHRYIQPGWVCYDIGSYKGYYAGIMAMKGASEVYVFEPMPSNIERLKKLISLNKGLPIQLMEYAVSDTSGTISFKLMPEHTMGKIDKSTFQQEDAAVSQITVKSISLDDFTEEGYPGADFIKIDVEGAEEFVLKGAVSLLERKKPVLMIEVHSVDIGQRCFSFLKNYYKSVIVFETGRSPEFPYPEISHFIATNS